MESVLCLPNELHCSFIQLLGLLEVCMFLFALLSGLCHSLVQVLDVLREGGDLVCQCFNRISLLGNACLNLGLLFSGGLLFILSFLELVLAEGLRLVILLLIL